METLQKSCPPPKKKNPQKTPTKQLDYIALFSSHSTHHPGPTRQSSPLHSDLPNSDK